MLGNGLESLWPTRFRPSLSVAAAKKPRTKKKIPRARGGAEANIFFMRKQASAILGRREGALFRGPLSVFPRGSALKES